MTFDFKKEYKDLYQPKTTPSIIEVPKMNFIAVKGQGNPNDEDGAYKTAIGKLYGIAYTLKMSYKTEHQIPGFFQYSVLPLEGFWWQPGVDGFDYADKENFHWISVIRLPEFVTKDEFDWAVKEATAKKKADFSSVEYLTIEEGLCVQCMHIGPYDEQPRTIAAMKQYAMEQGYTEDFSAERLHHEIYLGDPRRSDPAKLKTVIRHPIRKS